MKIYAFLIIDKKSLSCAFDLMSFNYFKRNSIQEFIIFGCNTLAKRTNSGECRSVKHEQFVIHIIKSENDVSYLCVSDDEYPSRVIYDALNKIQNDEIRNENELHEILKYYQDPSNVDKISRVKKELENTIETLRETIDSVLNRGEKLDTLVKESVDLSLQSKIFYENSKDKCCIIC